MASPQLFMHNPRYSPFTLLLLPLMCFYIVAVDGKDGAVKVDVGVIIDLDTVAGKIKQTCIFMALTDFYAKHNYTTRIVPHPRDAKSDVVDAAAAAIDLIKNVQVQAILGPQGSTEADFVVNIGNKSQVPIFSAASSPSISPEQTPYFVRAAQDASFQVKVIAAIVKAFGWREVVFIYEDNDYGRGVVPYLTDELQKMSFKVPYGCGISPSAADDQILKELYKMKTMQTRVFVVHMLPSLASRFFLKVEEAGMMEEGYAWIITDALTSLLESLDSGVIELMQGVLGVKPYVKRSKELDNFSKRWRKKFLQEHPDMDRIDQPSVYGLWAYDSVVALAMAVERAYHRSVRGVPRFKKPVAASTSRLENSTDLAALGTSEMGPKLLQSLRNMKLKGLSGDFHLVDGELQESAFQIVNIIGKEGRQIGRWTKEDGLSGRKGTQSSTQKKHFEAIIWPGESKVVPKGWEMPAGEKKLRVGVPMKGGFHEFMEVERDPQTNKTSVRGFCKDLFQQVMATLPYYIPYDFFPFETPDGQAAGGYDDLVHQVFLEKYDAVVGDITIVAKRSKFVDFTLPFADSGVSMIVPVKTDKRRNAWIFMRPLTKDLWLTTWIFFIYTGFVVWVLEHRVNKEFRGPPRKHVGMIFWFSFSTLVFAHKEKVTSNLTKFVLIIWVFVVLVLTSSYTASLTSMLTVQKLEPSITSLADLLRKGESVGYQKGSFVAGFLEDDGFDPMKLKGYSNVEEYYDALSRGSKAGGVAAIIDETPYIRLFLQKYCSKYTMVGLDYWTGGLGFAFPRGSPLLPDVSRMMLNLTQGVKSFPRNLLGDGVDCAAQDGTIVTSDSLTLDSFKGLFVIAGLSSTSALVIFLLIFLYDNRDILASDATIQQKLAAMAKAFDQEKCNSSDASRKTTPTDEEIIIAQEDAVQQDITSIGSQSPATSLSRHADGIFFQDEGLSTTEPGTPMHDTQATAITTEITEEK